MEKRYLDKEILKKFISDNRLNETVTNLIFQLNEFLDKNQNYIDYEPIRKLSDALIMNSGKLNGLEHDKIIGILDREEQRITLAEVQRAVLVIIDKLPERFWNFKYSNIELSYKSKLIEGVELLHKQETNFEYDIFICFSTKDREIAIPVWEFLRGYGLKVFVSDEDLKNSVGLDFLDAIDKALTKSQHLFLLASSHSLNSVYVIDEYKAFYNDFHTKNPNNRLLFAYLLEKTKLSDLPRIFRNRQVAKHPEQIVNSLVKDLQIDYDASIKEKEQTELKRKQEEEQKAKKQADLERKQEEEQKAKEQAELVHKQEEERKAKEQAKLERKQEEERKAKEQAEFVRKQEEERKAKEQAELERKQVEERKAKEQAELARKQEEERKTKEQVELEQKQAKLKQKNKQETNNEHNKVIFKPKLWTISLILSALCIVCFSVFYVFEPFSNKDEEAFEAANSKNTIDAFEFYLSEFPNGKYNNNAKQLIDSIDNVQEIYLFNNAQTIDDYKNYINTYPHGKYLEKAKEQINIQEIKQKEKNGQIVWKDSTNGSFLDTRDTIKYNVVKIGNQIWFAENLKYKAIEGCWAYKNDINNVEQYGYLYNWNSAINSCPTGWHLPSDDEWKQLEMFCGATQKETEKYGLWRAEGVGSKLKSTTLWKNDKNGVNEVGFKALPGGYKHYDKNTFVGLHEYGCWWTSTPHREGIYAWQRQIYYKNTIIYRNCWNKGLGYSVRCIKD